MTLKGAEPTASTAGATHSTRDEDTNTPGVGPDPKSQASLGLSTALRTATDTTVPPVTEPREGEKDSRDRGGVYVNTTGGRDTENWAPPLLDTSTTTAKAEGSTLGEVHFRVEADSHVAGTTAAPNAQCSRELARKPAPDTVTTVPPV